MKDLEVLFEHHPNFPGIFTTLGFAYHNLGDTKLPMALGAFNVATTQNPRDAKALFGRGVVYRRFNVLSKSVIDLQASLALEPCNPEILYECGYSLMLSRKFEEALDMFDKLLRLRSNHNRARMCRSHINFVMKNLDKALIDYNSLLTDEPDNPVALTCKGLVRFKSGSKSAAFHDLNMAVKIGKDEGLSLLFRGSVHYDNIIQQKDQLINQQLL